MQNIKKVDTSNRCSECSQSLEVIVNGEVRIRLYKPQSNGLTLIKHIGFQCSNKCYIEAIKKHN